MYIQYSDVATRGVLKNKLFSNLSVKIFSQNPWKISMKKFIFSKTAGWKSATLLKMSFFIGIFQGFWRQRSEHLFCRISFSGCFRIFAIAVCQVHYKNPVMKSCKRIHKFLQQYPWCKLRNFVKKKTPTQLFSCKYCKTYKNTYFEELLWTAASEITCFFIKHSDLISFFYKNNNEKKRNSIEITQTYVGRKNCNKIKKIWATAVHFFEKY